MSVTVSACPHANKSMFSEDGKCITEFIDKCFKQCDISCTEGTPVIEISDETVNFERCIFKDFDLPLMFVKGKSIITFNNCSFENIHEGITVFDNAIVNINNCQFSNVHDFCLWFKDNSSFKIENMKISNFITCSIIMEGESNGILENCEFSSCKESKIITTGINVYGETNLKLNKCKFKDLGFGIISYNKGTVLIMECEFTENKTSFACFKNTKFSVFDSHFKKQREVCCYSKDSAVLNFYNLDFNSNKGVCIKAEGNTKLKLFCSKFADNSDICVYLTEDSNGHIYDCSIGENIGPGVLLENNSACDVSKSKLYDNDASNFATLDNSNGILESNEIFFDKVAPVGNQQINLNCQQESKCYLENNNICGYEDTEDNQKTVIGILASNNANVFVKGCTLKTLLAVGIYEDSSEILLTNSIIKDFYDVYAQGDSTAVFKTISCIYEDFDDKVNFE